MPNAEGLRHSCFDLLLHAGDLPMKSSLLLKLLAVCTLAGAGCGGGTGLTEVEGVVTLNGKPLDDVQIDFLPDPVQETRGPRSSGVSDAQGRFKLVSVDQRPGAVIGTHRVLITDLKQWEGIRIGREDSNKPLKPSRLPDRYTNERQTPFKNIEVKAGGAPIKLDLTSP
jgi:hypothetical protein